MEYLELGQLALSKGDHQEALNIFRRALEVKKSGAAYAGLGKTLYHLGDYASARWALTNALDRDPRSPGVREFLDRIEGMQESPPPRPFRTAPFRIRDGRFEVKTGSWRRLFLKGINLGVGLPGYYPGEFPVRRDAYLRWFGQMADLGVNCLRIYTIHPPAFYEALARFNGQSRRKLYLLQGVWAELPEQGDFMHPAYLDSLQRDIRNALDALHGNADLPERRGEAHGVYRWDVSPSVCGMIFGREWESCAVKRYDELKRNERRDFTGTFLRIRSGSPFERWVTMMADYVQSYEHGAYGLTRPVSVVNWPTLDPLAHPAEADQEQEAAFTGRRLPPVVCNENEDSVTVDTGRIESTGGAGFFSSYHVYPYYPDFLNHDYGNAVDPYLAYLRDLQQHHRGQAVLIAEFGVPSSRDSAHWHRLGWHQGAHTETQQGEINGRQMQAIQKAGLAGGLLFSWFDEWFKNNWVFSPFENPQDRRALWFNSRNPEQNYGLVAAYPGYPGKIVSLSGRAEEWAGAVTLYTQGPDQALHRFHDAGDDSRTLTGCKVLHDEGFLYVLVETAGPADFEAARYCIGLSTAGPDQGETLLPFGTRFRSPVALTFLLHLAGRTSSRILTTHEYDRYLNHEHGMVRPGRSDQGQWVMMQDRTNVRRISKEGKRFFPPRVFSGSDLRFGSLDRGHPDHDSRADFFVSGRMIECRIPWALINVSDPSSHRIVWVEGRERSRTTKGIAVMVASYKPEQQGHRATATGKSHHAADTLPRAPDRKAVRMYTWDGWYTPVYHLSLKESYYRYREVLAGIPEHD